LKFIENSIDRPKTTFNFKIVGTTISREEVLFSSITKLDSSAFNTLVEQDTIDYNVLKKYDNSTWSGQETLAPTLELKTFDAEDN
ncbi:MAG: hypothetical protein ACJARX_001253, partial [Psychroserpens sp.]